jgi:hypothetical protein
VIGDGFGAFTVCVDDEEDVLRTAAGKNRCGGGEYQNGTNRQSMQNGGAR